jgi:hypothetical protein
VTQIIATPLSGEVPEPLPIVARQVPHCSMRRWDGRGAPESNGLGTQVNPKRN